MAQVKVKADYLFKFNGFDEWVNRATEWYKKAHAENGKSSFLTIDTNGNSLVNGEDFQVARDKNTFPVRVYALTRTTAANK